MDEYIVINTGPLIALERMRGLDIPPKLPYQFIAPEEVKEELDAGARKGYGIIAPAWLSFHRLGHQPPLIEVSSLGKGEAAVIALALEKNIERVCIDEWKGRRAALMAGRKVLGALGILGRAKSLGLVSALRPFINRAISCGIRYDQELIRQVLHAAGED
ncbi:MAG TPA: DUF3368 domain-containing protein [Kiritimatiellia bacterium]|nr:DUF3368 domain-containing protein [Kiritimatiellia bacterium]HMO99968.1 DUF3368 domain-containing protein [Kiritimatiellia bacterium]